MVGQSLNHLTDRNSDASWYSGEETFSVRDLCETFRGGTCGLWTEVRHQGLQGQSCSHGVDCAASTLYSGKREPISIYLDLAKTSMNISLESFLSTTATATSCATASVASFAGKSSAMIYYSVDPQFGALLFSLYSRNERCSLFVDPFATCAFAPSTNTDLVGYAHSTLVQLLELSQHYACFLSQVRAGSVVLLVGVGSLVCWRLWAHWRYGAGDGEGAGDKSSQASPNASPSKVAQRGGGKRPGLLASLLEEELFQESEDLEEDDPAFIQGRYFGPDSPGFQSHQQQLKDGLVQPGEKRQRKTQRAQLLGTPVYSSEDHNNHTSSSYSSPSDQRYLADNSSSTSSRDKNATSSSGDEDMEEVRAAARSRRRKKRLMRVGSRNSGSSYNSGDAATEKERKISNTSTVVPQEGNSCSSARGMEQRSTVRFYANAGTDEEYSDSNSICAEDNEGMWSGASYTDLMERMRHRQARRSLSREPSVASNLSDIHMSPSSSLLYFPFKRDDSVCSNLSNFSDYTLSECSEMSMDISVKEEVNHTFRCLEEIEHDLHDLKSSVLQMDEEVAMFVTKPDPYSLKITFSDYSLSSKEDNDSLQVITSDSLSSSNSGARQAIANFVVHSGDELIRELASGGQIGRASDTDAEYSLEWDSPQHGWSSVQPITAKRPMQDDNLVSLEWDDGAVKQHPEPKQVNPIRREDSEHTFHDNIAIGRQLLPDHSSMELDLEEELAVLSPSMPSYTTTEQPLSLMQTTDNLSAVDTNTALSTASIIESCSVKPDPAMTASTDSAIVTSMTGSCMTLSSISNSELNNSFTIAANMTGSTDSAFYSGPGSRSATTSPLPAMFSQSTLSSSGFGSFGSCNKVPPDEGASQTADDRDYHLERASSFSHSDRAKTGDVGRRIGAARWSSEESGFAEPDDGPHACLSPVRELKEREHCESNTSSPRHLSSSLSNICDISIRRSTEGLNLVINDNETFDSLNGNTIAHHNLRNELIITENNTASDNLNLNQYPTETFNNETKHDNLNENISNQYPIETFDNEASHLADNNYNFSAISQEAILDNTNNTRDIDDTVNGNCSGMSNNSELDRHRSRSASPASRHTLTIGEKVKLTEYCSREWRGSTAKAKTMRQGYSEIEAEVGLSKLRCVRGDQYCGIRATLFQALAAGHPLPRSAPAVARIVAELMNGGTWIMGWNFANRIHYGNTLDGIRDCLETMDYVSDNLVGCLDREATLEQLFNGNSRVDVQLCEAVKLHMLVSALLLHSQNNTDGNVPLFAMIMFARQSSQTPAQFMKNHLNVVGDTGGLEQIEMFLLGHCLKATLQVVRPSSYGSEDFICYYPDTNIGVWPQFSLIAEDDRHYNVIVE